MCKQVTPHQIKIKQLTLDIFKSPWNVFWCMFVQQKPSTFSNFCNGTTTFAKLGIKSPLLCIMQMKDPSSSLSFGDIIFSKSLTFSVSGFKPSEVNSIPKNFISGLPKIHFSFNLHCIFEFKFGLPPSIWKKCPFLTSSFSSNYKIIVEKKNMRYVYKSWS